MIREYYLLRAEVARLEALEGETQSLQTGGLKRIKENSTQKSCFLIEAREINTRLREELVLLESVLEVVIKTDIRGEEGISLLLQKWRTEAAFQQDLYFHSKQPIRSPDIRRYHPYS
eukprot:Protomagalhaensia_wolfi_Nauph_80__2885@NODE_297_length_2866_cov_267_887513_g216_i1_p3_GENE_NODE_297_length_2866_cov_267_887513_g216_i1NODE_297_length_2866_cov_267_887513_g216_i1_p3_ORF_typecomplete_len117_score16_05NUT/PF12881_7/0_15_NODE_297_length_2866_cov_267_887513_g216_i119072257